MESPTNLLDKMHDELISKNIRFRIVSINRLNELKQEMSEAVNKIPSRIIADFVQSCFDYDFINKTPWAQTIIIASVFDPVCNLNFQIEGQQKTVVVAPGYMKLPISQIKPADALQSYFGNDFKIEPISIPAKILAVKSGLAKYGRNNLCYVEGFGSFHKLVTFVSDFPANDFSWQPISMLENCLDCQLCLKNCPTGSIINDRIIIDAEKCLTYYNERDEDFPDWVKKEWHNSLLGCMLCQNVCPYNREVLGRVDDRLSFSEFETHEFLIKDQFEELSISLQNKITTLGYQDFYSTVAKNLRLLI